ncbi:MAG: replicative DNA helicase, partial [Bacteroidales bacterium]|nr:replicative DNA helicase [Bacteroidales bacterium]
LDNAQQQLFDISQNNIRKGYENLHGLIAEAVKQINKARQQPDNLSGVPSGFSELDRVTSGWQNSDLIILAARPAMGKTAFVLSMARYMAVDRNIPVAFFSLEMSSLQLITRLIASEAEISAEKLRKGTLEEYEWQQLHSKIANISEAPLYIDDTPALSIFELKAKCRRLKSQYDIKAVFVDYLQLMSTSGDNKGNREQEISSISRALKGMAKELNIPVIALSQLSRAVETRGGTKKPMLSDLRESGAIEQDADLVLFIYRAEYYKIMEDEDHQSTQGMAEIIVAKHRNGALADVKLRFQANIAKFSDLIPDSFTYNNVEPNVNFNNTSRAIRKSSKMNDDDLPDSSPLNNNNLPLDDVPF